jgi:hypothetical protein
LNPNVAVNGLNGQQNDGISPYIRQGADVMYGIAVDLLLLLFILCIWKFWADASWGGAGNLMSPVGRLIFTAGLLLAWPTLYAFEIQISNEMIKAIYFNSADQVLMLDYALAQAVKGGLIAAGAGATSVFAPLLANLAIPVAGQFVGQLFYFASVMIFTVLGGILIAELVYILILKAIQTALLTTQYMFAPIFLVFFATPDTESYATGFVRAFVETSLWTFVWVGLLKVMTIILFSNFNPWGKILISIGVLQLMIQVPSFLGRAQISPASDFFTAGLAFGTIQKALGGLGTGLTSAIGQGVSWFTDGRYADKGLQQTKDAAMTGLPGQTANPELLNSLNKASQAERDRNKQGPGVDPSVLAGPNVKTPQDPTAAMGNKAVTTGTEKPGEKPPTKLDPATGKPITSPAGEKSAGTVTAPPAKPKEGLKTGALTAAGLATVAGIAAAAGEAADAKHGTGTPEMPKGPPPDPAGGGDKSPKDRFEWGKSNLEGWNEANLIHVDTRKLLGQLTSVNGVGLRTGQGKTSALGSTAHGVQRVNIAEGASDSEMAHAIYSAAFANNVASDDPARDAARQAAVQSGARQPRGLMENMAANWLSNTGSSWNKTAIAKERFQQAMFEAAVQGSQSYVSRQKGNAYTDYLRGRYGEWGDEQDAMAVHLITNPDSSESPWNRNIGPATDALVSSGIPIGADTRGAMQNMAIQAMHPARRKQAVFAALSATYQQAKELYGNEHPAVFALAHGEMARAMSSDDVNNALTMYQMNGQEDLNTTMAPMFMGQTAAVAGSTGRDYATAYASMAATVPFAARKLGYLPANINPLGLHSYTDVAEAIVIPAGNGQSVSQAMQVILQEAGSTLGTLESHKIPMTMVTNSQLAPEVFAAISHLAPDGIRSPQGSRVMRVVSKNLGMTGVSHTADTIEAMYSWEANGGSIDRITPAEIILAEQAYKDGGIGSVKPIVIQAAISQGRGLDDSLPWAEIEKQANAVISTREAVKTSSSAPVVLETFARQVAAQQNINTSNMSLAQVLVELDNSSGGAYSPANIAQQVVQLSRQGGGFSDHQLQDPMTVEMLLDRGQSHRFAPQAINVVTRLVGSTEAYNNPGYLNVVEEYLDNDGKMREMDQSNFYAAVALSAAKEAGLHGPRAAEWANVKISPKFVKMMQRDPGYSIQNPNNLSSDLIDSILRSATRI